ncbi:hypothetical protein IJ531_02175 [bacterium]|nr:hypothetical protein [bacterium]
MKIGAINNLYFKAEYHTNYIKMYDSAFDTQTSAPSGDKLQKSLDALAQNNEAVFLAHPAFKLNTDYLDTVDALDRYCLAVRADDKLIPDKYSIHNYHLKGSDYSALDVYSSGAFGCYSDCQQEDFDPAEKNEQEQGCINTLDRLINSMTPLDSEYIVYRGIYGVDEQQKKFIESFREGKIINHKSYLAVAAKGDTDYVKQYLLNPDATRVIMRITLPKGTRGLLINGYNDEFVLPRNSKLKINSINKDYGIVEAEYIAPDTSSFE